MKFLPITLLIVASLTFSLAQAQPIKKDGLGMGKPGMGKPGMGNPSKYFDNDGKTVLSGSKRLVLSQIAKGNKKAAKRAILASKIDTTSPEEVEKIVDILFDVIFREFIVEIKDPQLANEAIENTSMAIGGAVAELALQNGAAEEDVNTILSAGAFVAVDLTVEFADAMQIDEPPAAEAAAIGFVYGAIESIEAFDADYDTETAAEIIMDGAVEAAQFNGIGTDQIPDIPEPEPEPEPDTDTPIIIDPDITVASPEGPTN